MIDISGFTEIEQKAILARREYQRQWRAANKDRVKAYNQRYWQRVAIKKDERKNSE